MFWILNMIPGRMFDITMILPLNSRANQTSSPSHHILIVYTVPDHHYYYVIYFHMFSVLWIMNLMLCITVNGPI